MNKYCTHCGAALNMQDKFCTKCGQEQIAAQQINEKINTSDNSSSKGSKTLQYEELKNKNEKFFHSNIQNKILIGFTSVIVLVIFIIISQNIFSTNQELPQNFIGEYSDNSSNAKITLNNNNTFSAKLDGGEKCSGTFEITDYKGSSEWDWSFHLKLAVTDGSELSKELFAKSTFEVHVADATKKPILIENLYGNLYFFSMS